MAAKNTKIEICDTKEMGKDCKFERTIPKVEDDDNTEDLKDMLALPGDLLDTDLVNSIINEDDDELTKNTGSLEALGINSSFRIIICKDITEHIFLCWKLQIVRSFKITLKVNIFCLSLLLVCSQISSCRSAALIHHFFFNKYKTAYLASIQNY